MTWDMKFALANRLSLIILTLLSLCILTIMFIAIYPFTPITFYGATLKQEAIRPGYSLEYYANFTKHVDKVGSLSRYLVSLNGESTRMLNSGLADAKTTDKRKLNTVEIPHNTRPGKYKIRVVVLYEYFGIRQIRTSFETPVFEVVK